MARDYPSSDISHVPELVRLAEQVRATGRPRLLRSGREELAVLMPVQRRHRRRSMRPLTPEEYHVLLAVGGAPRSLLPPVQLRLEL